MLVKKTAEQTSQKEILGLYIFDVESSAESEDTFEAESTGKIGDTAVAAPEDNLNKEVDDSVREEVNIDL